MARKTLKALKGSTFNTIKYVMKTWGLEQDVHYKINNLEGLVVFYNGSTISLIELEDLPPDPEFERLGSNEWSCGFIDECSQVSEKAVEILYSRLRWRVSEDWGYARLLMTTNPSMNWVRSRFVQDDEGNPVILKEQDAFVQFGVFDNPDLSFVATYRSALDKLTDQAARHRLLYGVWDWVGTNEAAAYWNFKGEVHLVDNLREKVYNPLNPLVLSFDFNVVPYMSCLVLQFDYTNKRVYVLEEILGKPEDKENNTPAFARKISQKYLNEKHVGGLVVTGDPAGLARSTQTEEGVNNYTILLQHLHRSLRARKTLLSKQPSQISRLDFANLLLNGYNGWTVSIDMRCRKFTEDLIYQKKNEDGTKSKAKVNDPKLGVKYERYGHLSDCFDYAICRFLSSDYARFTTDSGSCPKITTYSGSVYGTFDY